METKTVLSALAQALVARGNCIKSGNAEWLGRWEDVIDQIARDFLPSGSGFDSGTKVDLSEPRGVPRSDGFARIIFTTSFHHMNDGGMYDGWTEHEVKVTPCLHSGFNLSVSGRDRNDIKDYIAETFTHALKTEIMLLPGGEYVRTEIAVSH